MTVTDANVLRRLVEPRELLRMATYQAVLESGQLDPAARAVVRAKLRVLHENSVALFLDVLAYREPEFGEFARVDWSEDERLRERYARLLRNLAVEGGS